MHHPLEKLSKLLAGWLTLLGQYQPVLEWAQPVAVLGLVPQLGAGVVWKVKISRRCV
jgi:hypothetical protein